MGVEFIDNSIKCRKMIGDAGIAWLYEACGEVEAQAKRNSKRASGDTAGSFRYKVDETSMEGYVGSDHENAIWEEFGTGEYALNGDGRNGGWWIEVGSGRNQIPLAVAKKYRWVKVRKDKNGNLAYVFTKGKKPRRSFFKAYTSLKGKLQRRAEEILGGIE
ncbi:hypothetical protein IMSAGC019_03126 [Lachnospiraceae bacterium]|nr:hypothetical protein IMSAGC019_03126 [Lachnospiraceae bacterium]